MKNITEFLEKNVQWVALGLGGIYLLWMVYGYVLQPAVTVQWPGAGAVTPIEAEEKIQDRVQALRRVMDNRAVPEFKMEEFAADFSRIMHWEGFQPISFALIYINSQTVKVKEIISKEVEVTERVAMIPQPMPPIEPTGVATGQSQVVVQPPPGALAAGGAALPAPAPAGGAAIVQANIVDKDWATPVGTIAMKAMAKAFEDAKLPPELRGTFFLQVEVAREELLPDGSWGNAVAVQPLPLVIVPPFPKAKDLPEEQAYKQWASAHQETILHPPFYQIAAGDKWVLPGTPVVDAPKPAGVVPPPPKPADVRPQTRPPADTARPRPSGTGTMRDRVDRPERPEPRTRRPGSYAPIDPERLGPLAQARPGGANDEARRRAEERRRDQEMDRQMMEEERKIRMEEMKTMRGPGGTGLTPGPGPVAPGPAGPQGGQIPAGLFNPADQPDVTVWAHDDTVVPGHTYRYKMRYSILNPLYQTRNIAKNPPDADVFAIGSDWSKWTTQSYIKPSVEFFVQGGFWNNTVKFLVFKRTGGVWHSKTFVVSPGDMIGGPDDKDKVDYSTNSTLIMIRDSDPPQAVVSDMAGNLARRDQKTDSNSERFKELNDAVKVAGTPPGPVSAGP